LDSSYSFESLLGERNHTINDRKCMKNTSQKKRRPDSRSNEATARAVRAEQLLRQKLGFMWQIHVLSHLMVRRVDPNITSTYGLSLIEWRIVITLARVAGLSAIEIIHSWGLEKMAVSRAVRLLLRLGLIRRTNEPKGSRRCPLLLTRKGAAMHRAAWPHADADYRRVTSVLTAAEFASFTRISDKLISQARRVTEVAPETAEADGRRRSSGSRMR
jgi:DNA-binding MarR family transcriptional regulator